MNADDKKLVDAGIELMRANPKMSAGLASRRVIPGPENSKHRQSIRNAIDYIVRTTVTNVGTTETVSPAVKKQRRLDWFIGCPPEAQTPWKPSNAPWQADKPSVAFVKMLGDYSGDMGKWTQEYYDAQISPTVNPSGNGSSGSNTYCANPVIHACPEMVGTTAA